MSTAVFGWLKQPAIYPVLEWLSLGLNKLEFGLDWRLRRASRKPYNGRNRNHISPFSINPQSANIDGGRTQYFNFSDEMQS